MYREIMRNRKDAERYRRLKEKLFDKKLDPAALMFKLLESVGSGDQLDAALDNLKTNDK